MHFSWKTLIISAFCGVSLTSFAYANDHSASSAFPHFKKIAVGAGTVLVDPDLRHKKTLTSRALIELFDGNPDEEVLRVDCGKQTIEIGYSPGPSEDPMYGIVVYRGKKTLSKFVQATSLAISSSCQFYVSGKTNNSFDMRRKFVISEKDIKETEQPLYLVNEKCATSSPAVLTTQKCGKGTVVATIPKGSEVRILASEGLKPSIESDLDLEGSCGEGKISYLVASPFGLVGWVENKSGDIYGRPGQPLSCIIVYGD